MRRWFKYVTISDLLARSRGTKCIEPGGASVSLSQACLPFLCSMYVYIYFYKLLVSYDAPESSLWNVPKLRRGGRHIPFSFRDKFWKRRIDMPISISSRQLIPLSPPSKTKHGSTRQQKDARRDAIKKNCPSNETKKKKSIFCEKRSQCSAYVEMHIGIKSVFFFFLFFNARVIK